ncbi:MAG: hypothetical protein AAF393_00715 [Pseudomonadota bacterium]
MRLGFAIAILTGVVALGANAQAETISLSTQVTQDCQPMIEDEANCTYFAGCITPNDDWFRGEARGWDGGKVTLNLNSGVTCEGDWDFRSAVDSGSTQVTCSDGERFELSFFLRGEDGTAMSGNGITKTSRRITIYGGPGAADYLRTRTDTDNKPEFSCGGVTIRLE